MSTDDYEYAPTRSERKQTDWDIEIASDRSSIYREIELFLTSNCSSIQGYKIAHNETNLEWSHPDFYISSIVAKNNNDEWLCLIPRVPDQASIYGRKRGDKEFVTPDRSETNLSLSNELTTILDRLKPLQMYGYYHGGYNYTYSHQIYCGISSTKETAIELALQFANMVTIARPTDAYRHDGYNSDRISQFMNECLRDRTRYSVSFWDLAYTYELGKTPDGDWIGVRSFIEFEYNP